MTTYARTKNNIAVEIFIPPIGFAINQCLHPDVVQLFSIVPDGTQSGSTYAKGIWTKPTAPAPVQTSPTVYPVLSPTQFYLAFTPAERMKIKALASTGGVPANSSLFGNSTAIPQDQEIAEFWETFKMSDATKSPIDPNLSSVQEGLMYMSNPTAPTPVVITAVRIPQILAGIPQ
jgi:hypothetical protein